MIVPALHELVAGLASPLRKPWLLLLATVIICSAFGAHAVAAFVEADRMVLPPTPAPPARPAPPAPPPRPTGDLLVARNMFCSTCVPRPPGADVVAEELAILIATGVGSDPRAVLRIPSTEVAGAWQLGDEIPGIGRLVEVRYTSITVERDGRRRTIALFASEAAGPTGAATPVTSGPPPFPGVTQLAEGSYEVERRLVRDLVSSAASPRAGMRAQPVLDKDGGVKGLRLFGVRADSFASAVGLKSGDVLSTIDGQAIKTLDQMLDLYAKLDQMSAVEIGGTRAGKPLQIQFRLR